MKNSEQVKELLQQYEKKIQLVKNEEKPVPVAPIEPRIVLKSQKLIEICRDDVSFFQSFFCWSEKLHVVSARTTVSHNLQNEKQDKSPNQFVQVVLWAGERLLLVRIF